MRTEFPFRAIESLSFASRPAPVSANLRPLFRISLLLLVLRLNCSRGTASLLKLQFFNWVLKSDSLRDHVERLSKEQSIFTLGLVHLDPMVNLALKYAHADGLIGVTRNRKYELLDKGRHFAEAIIGDSREALAQEVEYLQHIGMRISEVRIKRDLELQ